MLREALESPISFEDRLDMGDEAAYLRTGLPPSPIAMPGAASLRAAVRPAPTKALYFVARGDGSSVFSDDLAAHNRAVNQYQRQAQNRAATKPAAP